MRQSPTKVVFNYNQQQQKNHRNTYQPHIVQSGYILGQPIAYTNLSHLPNQYQSFSPTHRNRASTDFVTSSRKMDYQAPDPSQFAPPPHRNSFRQPSPHHRITPQPSPPRLNYHNQPSPPKVSSTKIYTEQEYNRLLNKYTVLEQRYNNLEQRYFDLQYQNKSRVKSRSNKVDIIPLIQRYKNNLMDQFQLLMDRARLEEKEAQISFSRKR